MSPAKATVNAKVTHKRVASAATLRHWLTDIGRSSNPGKPIIGGGFLTKPAVRHSPVQSADSKRLLEAVQTTKNGAWSAGTRGVDERRTATNASYEGRASANDEGRASANDEGRASRPFPHTLQVGVPVLIGSHGGYGMGRTDNRRRELGRWM